MLYLGGTIHVLAPSDWPIPAAYEQAYRQSSRLVFETDIGQMSSPQTGQKIQQALLYEPPKNLRGVLSEATYKQLSSQLAQYGVDILGRSASRPDTGDRSPLLPQVLRHVLHKFRILNRV